MNKYCRDFSSCDGKCWGKIVGNRACFGDKFHYTKLTIIMSLLLNYFSCILQFQAADFPLYYRWQRERIFHVNKTGFLGARGCGVHTNSQIVNVSSYSNEQHTHATMKEANTEWKTENDEKTQFEFNYRKFLIDRFALHAVAEMFFLCSLCICGTLITMRLDMRAERVAQMLSREKRAGKWSMFFFRRNKLSRRRLIMNCDDCEVHFRFRINVSRVEDDQLWCWKSWVIYVSWQRGLNFSENLVKLVIKSASQWYVNSITESQFFTPMFTSFNHRSSANPHRCASRI